MNEHFSMSRVMRARVVAAFVVSSLALAACSSGAAPAGPASSKESASSSASASSSESSPEPSSASSENAEPVPVVPGYAPGVFPEVPAIVIPDVSLLTKSAPSFSVSLRERFEDLKGVRVTGAQCDAGGKPTTSTYKDGTKEVVTNGRGAGSYKDGTLEIVNNGDGSGRLKDATLEISIASNGSGTYKHGTLMISVDGKGAGSHEDATYMVVNNGDGSGTHKDATLEIVNNGDGSGSYKHGTLTITNDGKGTAHIKDVLDEATVEAKPLAKLAPVGKFPTLAALTPDNICGVLVTVESEVLFDFGKSEVRSDAESTLSDVASALNEVKAPKVEVIGHTDSVDSEEFNQKLSEERAKAVVEVLKGDGATADLVATGKGESQPVAPNTNADGSDNPSGRQLNRRVEIFIPKF